jgi:hypothetical protein
VVEGVVRNHKRCRLVLERQPAQVCDERLHVVDPVGYRRVVEPVEHRLRAIDREELVNAGSQRESEQPGAGTEIDHPIVRSRRGELDDPVADGEERVACGDLLPHLDALVPAVWVLAHR